VRGSRTGPGNVSSTMPIQGIQPGLSPQNAARRRSFHATIHRQHKEKRSLACCPLPSSTRPPHARVAQPGSPADPVFVQCRDILYILYRDILYSFWFGGGGLEGMITILPLSIGLLFWHDRLGWRSASGLCWRATRPGITSRRLIEAIKWGVACAAPHCIDRFPHAQKNSKLAFS
jgi:hypothetical protein